MLNFFAIWSQHLQEQSEFLLRTLTLFALGVIFHLMQNGAFLFGPVVKERLFCNNKAILNFGNHHGQFWKSRMH